MEGAMEQGEEASHVMPYPMLVRVWVLLVLLTAILVVVSTRFHEALAMWAMLVITPVKAGLVMFYFMHLKYEKTLLKALVVITLFVLIIFIGLTFSDLSYR
jgi:cytochrome c oxidase subunit IV